MEKVLNLLFENADPKYKSFHSALIPTVNPESIIGVRMPAMRKIAKTLLCDDNFVLNEKESFFSELPHAYYDENVLHALLVASENNFDVALKETNDFLPFVDNWAVCDVFAPKVFEKHKSELWKEICKWLKSDETYTVRFGIVNAMRHFLDEDYSIDKMKKVLEVKCGEYYVDMALAWYMSFALIKQWNDAIKVIEEKKLGVWVHNKSIQKAIESYRIAEDRKTYLKTFKIHE